MPLAQAERKPFGGRLVSQCEMVSTAIVFRKLRIKTPCPSPIQEAADSDVVTRQPHPAAPNLPPDSLRRSSSRLGSHSGSILARFEQ